MTAPIVITGSTSGIGLELARHYSQQERELILIGRKSLEDLDPDVFSPKNYLQLDLGSEDCHDRLSAHLQSKGASELPLIIHCAALGQYKEASQVSVEDIQNLVQVNLKSPIAITHTLLPLTIACAGKIVYISSVMSNMPCKEFASYAASKAALEAFARSLRVELKGQCSILVFQPGGTSTGMHKKAGVPEETISGYKLKSPEYVAQKIVKAIESDADLCSDSIGNSLISFAGRKFSGLISKASR